MLKHKNKSISAYKGDYRPVSIFENNKKIHGFKTLGMIDGESVFENTYNDALTIFGKSDNVRSVNLCPAPMSTEGEYTDLNGSYSWTLTTKENGMFDYSGCMSTGETVTKAVLPAGTYTVSGCKLLSLWWDDRDDFLYLPATFTLEKQTEVLVVLWYTEYEVIDLKNQYIQIEEGETASEYSPYIGSPLPDNICEIIHASGDIRVEGCNFLPPDFGIFSKWKLATEGRPNNGFVFELDLLPGRYLLIFNIAKTSSDGSYGYLYIQESTDNGETYKSVYFPIQNKNASKRYSFTVKETSKYRFWADISMEEKEDLFSDWSFQKTDIPEGKYKYFPAYNASIKRLEGIEVTADDEYNYCEEINGVNHYYLSNILTNNIFKRNVDEAVITGQENFLQKPIESQNYNCYYCDISHLITKVRNADKFLCNYFESLTNLNAEKTGAVLGQNDTNLYFLVQKSKFPELSDFANWLKTIFSEAPMQIIYKLDFEVISELEFATPFKSCAQYTRVIYKNNSDMNLGLVKCIKSKLKY